MTDEPVVIVDEKGVEHEFPSSMDPVKAASIVRGQSKQPQSDSSAIGLAAVAPAAHELMRFGTSPTAAKTGGMVGRIAGAIAPMVQGAFHGPMGAVTGALESPMASWAGGKTGYFGTQMLQSAARPISGALQAIAPAAARLSGVQGVNDLAQMAEPTRKDIGFLGMGPSQNVPGAEPPWLNAVLGRLYGRLTGK